MEFIINKMFVELHHGMKYNGILEPSFINSMNARLVEMEFKITSLIVSKVQSMFFTCKYLKLQCSQWNNM